MNTKIYSVSVALLFICAPYALAASYPNPPKVIVQEQGTSGAGVLIKIKWTRKATDVGWYAVERVYTHQVMGFRL